MVRISLRGGVWKNAEDEVLKAAIMKYGLNNWSRVASLLVRKSAKQCKNRWYEYLDPHVNKAEWTREEDEKVLHLAKLFPCQWRTIAPLVGRTAHQCLERYERLLDQAQGHTEEEMAHAAEIRRLRPGEIDPHPETKPSRADAVDLDDDEREMLAEARARLANTRGKKAKRKARERHLEEARRLATLQKTREMKAAGLGLAKVSRRKRQEDGLDYYNEIPFESQPPKGFYSTARETPEMDKTVAAKALSALERDTAGMRTKRLREADASRLKKLMDEDMPEALKIIETMNAPSTMLQRTALDLPQPELSNTDLEEILAMGKTSGSTWGSQDSHSAHLLGGRTSRPRAVPGGPFTGGPGTALMFTGGGAAATGLLGPAATNLLGPSATGLFGPATVASVAGTALYTPANSTAEAPSLAELRKRARIELSDLPAPAYDVEIEAQPAEVEEEVQEIMEEDADTIAAKREQKRLEEQERKWKQNTQVVQLNLPRPIFPEACLSANEDWKKAVSKIEEDGDLLVVADDEIFKEMKLLVFNDALNFPLAVKGLAPPTAVPPLEILNHNFIAEASAMIAAEVAEEFEDELPSFPFDEILMGPDPFLYDAENRVWVSTTTEEKPLLALYRQRFERLKAALISDAEKAREKEKKMEILTAGYAARVKVLKNSIKETEEKLQNAVRDLRSAEMLEQQEMDAIKLRVNEEQRCTNHEFEFHARLQRKYSEMMTA